MAARFSEISGEEIQRVAVKAVNKNTVKTTEKWMNVWKSWAESKGLNDDIVEYEAIDGSDYEPVSLRVKLAALDRHLKQNDSKISIAKDLVCFFNRYEIKVSCALPKICRLLL